ncbi:MAG: hypothetical protein HY302_00580 [Opitutae bacterium]|nr:hypothetical protein [Opitutae bacterium]
MKPAPRLTLVVLSLLLGLGAVAVGLALNSSFQRWLVLRAAGSQPGLKLDVAEVSVGLSRVSLRGVRLARHGVSLAIDRLEADYSLWSLLVERRLQIGRLVATGVLLDASKVARGRAEAGTAAGSAATPGVLSRVELPLAITLGDCDVRGRALLPGAPGKPPVQADYKISGGQIAPGQEGTLVLDARLTDPAPAARVSALRVQLSLRVVETAARSFSHVGVTAVVEAEGPRLAGQNQLKLAAQLSRTAALERYTVSLDTLTRGTAAHLLDVSAELPAGQKAYAGNWTVEANTAQIAPFFLGGSLSEFSASGSGRFSFQPEISRATLQGRLDVSADELGAIRPALRALGAVQLHADFDFAREGPLARLNSLDLTVAGAQPVLEVHATRAVEINLRERRLVVGPAALGEILRVKLLGLPLAWVRPFVTGLDVSGGNLTGELALVGDGTRLTAQTTVPLAASALTVVRDGRLVLGKAGVSVRASAELSATQLRARVQEFTLTTPAGDRISAEGEVVLPAAKSPAIAFTGRYTADLPALVADFLPLGPVHTAGETDLTWQAGRLTVRKWTADLTGAAGEKFFSAAALREFQFEPATGAVAAGPGSGAADVLRFSLGRVPLGPLLRVRAGVKITGTLEQGDFLLATDGGKLTVRATAPLKFSDVSVARNNRPLAAHLAVAASPSAVITGRSGLRVQSGEIAVRAADGTALLTATGEVSAAAAAGASVSGSFQIELPALASQPLFEDAMPLSAGRASGELRATVNGKAAQAEARVTLNNLVAREGGRPLPVANVSLRAVASPDGKISVQVPLLVDRAGQRSDLNFSAELAPAGAAWLIDAKLAGAKVELDDALAVLGVFFAPPAVGEDAPVEVGPAHLRADSRPALAQFDGRLALDVKSLTKGQDWTMSGLTGLVQLFPRQLKLEKLDADFGGKSRLHAKATVDFSAGATPYQLAGDFSLTEFDAGKLFQALDPGRPPTIEGLFTVAGKFAGTGATLPHTLQRTHGQFDLTSRQGIFRGLKRTTDKVSATTKAVELGASVLGSLFGQEKVTKAAEKLAGQAYFVDQLAASLGELPYDQFSVRLTRDDALTLRLENLSLVSPDLRLTGHGQVSYVAGKPLLDQPLTAELSLSGRGKIEQSLGKIGVLDGTRDDLGYAKTKLPVTIGGTLGRPDPSPFFTRVAKSKLTDFLTPDS